MLKLRSSKKILLQLLWNGKKGVDMIFIVCKNLFSKLHKEKGQELPELGSCHKLVTQKFFKLHQMSNLENKLFLILICTQLKF